MLSANQIFVTSENLLTYAFSADSGEMLWEHNTGIHNGIPVVSGDTVYVPSDSIYALSTYDGSERWSVATQDVVTSMPVIVQDTLYAGSYDYRVYALDTASGQARWIYEGDGRVYVAPIVDHGAVYAGIGNAGPRPFALDAQSGALLWQTTAITDTMAQLLVAGGLLYTSDRNGLVGLDPRDGTPVWRYRGMRGVSLLASDPVLYVATRSDDLYAADQSGDLYAFDLSTHRPLWQVRLRTHEAGLVTRLKLLGEELYVGFSGGGGPDAYASIHAVNTHTGSEDWSATVTGPAGSRCGCVSSPLDCWCLRRSGVVVG
jgi:outer membrane protein assembly factor BamB